MIGLMQIMHDTSGLAAQSFFRHPAIAVYWLPQGKVGLLAAFAIASSSFTLSSAYFS